MREVMANIAMMQEKRASLNADIDRILAQITDVIGIDLTEQDKLEMPNWHFKKIGGANLEPQKNV